MTSDLSVDRARAEDLDEVHALLRQHRLPLDGLRDHLSTTLVARRAGHVVGSAALEVYPDGALLRSVAVESGLRGHGIGRMLTEAAIRLAAEQQAPAMYLLTTTAEGYFPKYGFERIDPAEVPSTVRASVEFTSACPSTAVVMRRRAAPPRPSS
jgi:amino-acid N-acetyltransferase